MDSKTLPKLQEKQESIICSNCNSSIHSDDKFCSNCGKEVKTSKDEEGGTMWIIYALIGLVALMLLA